MQIEQKSRIRHEIPEKAEYIQFIKETREAINTQLLIALKIKVFHKCINSLKKWN